MFLIEFSRVFWYLLPIAEVQKKTLKPQKKPQPQEVGGAQPKNTTTAWGWGGAQPKTANTVSVVGF